MVTVAEDFFRTRMHAQPSTATVAFQSQCKLNQTHGVRLEDKRVTIYGLASPNTVFCVINLDTKEKKAFL